MSHSADQANRSADLTITAPNGYPLSVGGDDGESIFPEIPYPRPHNSGAQENGVQEAPLLPFLHDRNHGSNLLAYHSLFVKNKVLRKFTCPIPDNDSRVTKEEMCDMLEDDKFCGRKVCFIRLRVEGFGSKRGFFGCCPPEPLNQFPLGICEYLREYLHEYLIDKPFY